MIHSRTRRAIGALACAMTVVSTPIAMADTNPATVPLTKIGDAVEDGGGTTDPATAYHSAWAPGGAGSGIVLGVYGTNSYVHNARITYEPGTSYGTSDTCVDLFAISYYDNGKRHVRTAGRQCGSGLTSQNFRIRRNLDQGSPFCARIRIGNEWSNRACVTIKRTV